MGGRQTDLIRFSRIDGRSRGPSGPTGCRAWLVFNKFFLTIPLYLFSKRRHRINCFLMTSLSVISMPILSKYENLSRIIPNLVIFSDMGSRTICRLAASVSLVCQADGSAMVFLLLVVETCPFIF